MLIDSHAHLGDDGLFFRSKEILEKARLAGVDAIIDICTNMKTLERGLDLQKGSPPVPVFLAAATTPHDVEKEGDLFFPKVEESAVQKQLVAIGETGLDYYYEHSPKDLQKKHLVRYFHLAKQTKLPIIFHCREAFEDLFILADAEYSHSPAVLHCFTGTLEEAKKVLDRGWYISFSGILTFKKSAALQEIAKYVPLDRMFVETDSPYLAPQSKRGQVNEPAFVAETAQMVADLKAISLEKVAETTLKNVKRFFLL